jgi:hypothetical protein
LWRRCGHDERWFPCPGLPHLLLWRCTRGGPLPYTASAPDQGASRIRKPIRRSVWEITFLTSCSNKFQNTSDTLKIEFKLKCETSDRSIGSYIYPILRVAGRPWPRIIWSRADECGYSAIMSRNLKMY